MYVYIACVIIIFRSRKLRHTEVKELFKVGAKRVKTGSLNQFTEALPPLIQLPSSVRRLCTTTLVLSVIIPGQSHHENGMSTFNLSLLH